MGAKYVTKAIMLWGRPYGEADRILTAIRQELARSTAIDGHPIALHFSAGLTDAASHASPEVALQVADRLLYRAKEEGRERTVCDGPVSSAQAAGVA